jgi:TRAP-type C4-dicarboxylate transport system substrate-binding protein
MTAQRIRNTVVRMVSHVHKFTAAAIGVALLSTLAACGGGNKVTKQGETISQRVTFTMETPDASQTGGARELAQFFAQRVAALTHGHVHIVVANHYSSGHPDNEARLAVALREGQVQMAYIPSRAWERDGGRVLAFRALQAPFLITSYGVLRSVSTGPVGRALRATLRRNDLVGLGLVPDEMRRLLGRRPLRSASELRGARIRVQTSPTSVRMFDALGAIPVTSLIAEQVGPALTGGRLDGIESSAQAIGNNGYVNQARYLTANLALFPKTQTIVITRHAFDRLSAADRHALQQAAAETAAHANPGAEERSELRSLCQAGLRLIESNPNDVAALRRETEPVYAELERDSATKQAILAIQQLNQQMPVSNASLPTCKPAGTPQRIASAAPHPFPTGTFETKLTRAQVIKAGFPADNAHWETLTFRNNGTWLDVWFNPRRPDQPPLGGKYTVHGDTLTLNFPNTGRDVLKWSYFRGQLTFRVVSVPDPFAQFTYTAHPWRRIG